MADSRTTPPTGPDGDAPDDRARDQHGAPDHGSSDHGPAGTRPAQREGAPRTRTVVSGSRRVDLWGPAPGAGGRDAAKEPSTDDAADGADEPGSVVPVEATDVGEHGDADSTDTAHDAHPDARPDSVPVGDVASPGVVDPDTDGHRVDDIAPLTVPGDGARHGDRPAGTTTPEAGAEGGRTDTPVPVPATGATPTPDAAHDPRTGASGDPALDRDAARRAAIRDGVITARPPFPRFLQVVVALFFPVVVLAAAVRAVATSSFLWIEYNRPGFPADRFGFSLEDRMTYGSYALDYVLNFAPPRYLGDLTTPDGAPLFLESEVGHMADVKGVLGVAFAVALVMFVLSILACIHLARRYKGGVRRALFSGAVITLVGIAALAALALTAWETFFTEVHALFFPEGTWTFRVDDTLIRLFPEQFWTDSAVIVGLLVALATLLTLALTWPTRGRRERSKRAQEAEQTRYLESLRSS